MLRLKSKAKRMIKRNQNTIVFLNPVFPEIVNAGAEVAKMNFDYREILLPSFWKGRDVMEQRACSNAIFICLQKTSISILQY